LTSEFSRFMAIAAPTAACPPIAKPDDAALVWPRWYARSHRLTLSSAPGESSVFVSMILPPSSASFAPEPTNACTMLSIIDSATDASTEMSLCEVLFCGSVETPPIWGVVTATLSLRAIGSLPATDTASMSLRSSESTVSASASTNRLSPKIASQRMSTVEIAADAPTPTDLPPESPLPSLFFCAMPFLSAEALAVV